MASSHCRIEPATEADLPGLNDLYNHYVLTSHVTFDVEPTGIDWRRRWLKEHADPRHRVFVALTDEGDVTAFASSGPYRPKAAYGTTVETSIYVSATHIGHGIGNALYKVLFDTLDREDVHRALAAIAQPNPVSVNLHQRFGFYRVGHLSEVGKKFGRRWDVDWYERGFEGGPDE